MGIGIPELIIILLVIFLFVGPKKLPEAGKSMGKALKEFKKAVSGTSENKESSEEKQEVKEAEAENTTKE